jgi:hypothetical protein
VALGGFVACMDRLQVLELELEPEMEEMVWHGW